MTTARDVASIVGVSVSTVGRALSNDPRISLETREKVARAASSIGYAGNHAASVVRGNSSKVIGLLVPEVRNYFYALIAQALAQACDKEGFRLALSLTEDNPEIEARHVRGLAAAQVSGVIIVPTARPLRETSRFLTGIPHAQLLRSVADFDQNLFGVDDSRSLHSAVAHLAALGHRDIGFIGGHDRNSTGAARLAAFVEAMRTAGLTPDPSRIALGDPTREFGSATVRKWLYAYAPTAMISGAVNVTTGMVSELVASGKTVPHDMSLVGFGDPDWFSWWAGGISTIRPPIADLATSCCHWLLRAIRENGAGDSQSHSTMAVSTFQIRNSTRPVAKK